MKDEMKLTNVFKTKDCTVRVYRPVLTEKEREQRIEDFKKTCARVMMQVEREHMQKEAEEKSAAEADFQTAT